MKTYTINANGFWIKDMIIHEATQMAISIEQPLPEVTEDNPNPQPLPPITETKWQVKIEYWVEVKDAEGDDITGLVMSDGRQIITKNFNSRPSIQDVFSMLSLDFTKQIYQQKKEHVGIDLKLIQMPAPVVAYIPAEMPLPPGAVDITPA